MKYLEEFRNPDIARRLLDEIRGLTTRPWAMMEVCGGQTHSIIRNGIDQLLPPEIELIHGPGCPVCVTPLEMIDKALAIAARPDVTFCSFGDMLRVPGSGKDLLHVKSEGGDVRIVYSPLDAVKLAQSSPHRQVVFFGIGFETTPWPYIRPPSLISTTFPYWSRMYVCRPPSPPSWSRLATACRHFSPPATCAVSWAIGSTSPWSHAMACR
jgi:hydrogenase expression/formation protein HypD